MSSRDQLQDLRLADVVTFLTVRRSGSISAAARALDVTPSQVSKAIRRLEGQIRRPLLARSSRGVVVSEAAQPVVPHLEAMVAQMRRLEEPSPGANAKRELTIAAPSYLGAFFLPAIARSVPDVRIRGLQLAPSLIRAYAVEGSFDVALVSGSVRFPRTWVMEQVGELRQALYAAPSTAKRLGRAPVPEAKVREVPFISPIASVDGEVIPAEDNCPLDINERIVGHEVATIALALEIAAGSEQVVFGPLVAATDYLESGKLVAVQVQGWNVREPLFLACNGDRVMARTQRDLLRAVRESLKRAQQG